MFTCALRVFGCSIQVSCEDAASFELIRECYSAFLQEAGSESASGLRYDIAPSDETEGWNLRSEGKLTLCPGTSDLLYDFEKIMTMRLQLLRSDLFFVHAAVLSSDARCLVISGPSGCGKSTLAWSLCHAGFGYLSDELAPIHPVRMQVEPYPHALCLKTKPHSGPPLPASTVYTQVTMHVPAYELPTHAPDRACPIGVLVFIDTSRNGRNLDMSTIGIAEAAARLYSNGLNQLAHTGSGLPVARSIAGNMTSYLMSGGTVEERSLALRDLA